MKARDLRLKKTDSHLCWCWRWETSPSTLGDAYPKRCLESARHTKFVSCRNDRGPESQWNRFDKFE